MRRAHIVALSVLAGLLWRLWLAGRYAGWEESDYGNLAMVRGVLDGGFRHYDMNHMPGYYALGAVALAAVGDAVIAAKGVSLLGGLVALGIAVSLSHRLAGPLAAGLTGLLLVFQPEFALYAASSLREPVYAAAVLGMLLALSGERLMLAGLLAGGAFLIRMDGALALGPVLVVHALGMPGRAGRLLRSLAPLVLIIAAWSVYCRIDHGTFLFWSHSVSVNVETGLSAEAISPLDWWRAGLSVSGTLVGWMMPWRIGWGIWLGLILAVLTVPWRRHGLERSWVLLAILMTGVWAGIGLVGQHDPVHNLYWKWLCPIVPVVVPLGVAGLVRVSRRFGGRVLLAVVLLQALGSGLKETHRQWALSESWYRPQLDIAQWIEAEIPEDVPLLIDNIPACWINRRPHARELVSWFDVPVVPGDEADFARWVTEADIGLVLWFREDWTQAPVIAPFLAEGGYWSQDGVSLTERGREDGYGWILYEVHSTLDPP
ncbi:MAG: hypothetical protein ACI8RZ_006413 [Myxococcota bacterium]|jgi:hypothetical protein